MDYFLFNFFQSKKLNFIKNNLKNLKNFKKCPPLLRKFKFIFTSSLSLEKKPIYNSSCLKKASNWLQIVVALYIIDCHGALNNKSITAPRERSKVNKYEIRRRWEWAGKSSVMYKHKIIFTIGNKKLSWVEK